MSAPNSSIRPLVAGNWKMNGLKASLAQSQAICDALKEQADFGADVMICPPASLIMVMAEVHKDSKLMVGGQDCHTAVSGAHTGEVSAEMLADAGACAVIVGHSERRSDHAETDAHVLRKAEAAHRAGLMAIVCLGEALGERRAGLTLQVIARQLAGSLPATATATNTTIAYEPVWAIGTGLTPSAAQVGEVHASIRASLAGRIGGEGEKMRILYGGSVKPDNAAELLAIANVNGALVGGASLKAEDLLAIVRGVPRTMT